MQIDCHQKMEVAVNNYAIRSFKGRPWARCEIGVMAPALAARPCAQQLMGSYGKGAGGIHRQDVQPMQRNS